MLFKNDILQKIKSGEVDLAFRKWKRPTVKSGGSLLTPIGQLEIITVESINREDITMSDLRSAGFEDFEAMDAQLNLRLDGNLYKIKFRLLGEDPRIALRNNVHLSDEDLRTLKDQLSRYDKSSRQGLWTSDTLQWISENPGRRAGDMADELGFEKMWLKRNIRKLKSLGLTVSLGTGYKLSPRGEKALVVL